MPVGIQRLNAKKSQPNPRIIFIKPLKGPDEAIALDFLERIAAQCLPIMKEHTLSVMSLEEYEPNREFVGRNFNAGEVIQLVLKSPSTGRWLPFNYVQMVMMHELAHCKQMNHSKAFWAVRNQYAEQMRILWSRTYTGEGLWGRGALLSTGDFERNTVHADELLPEHTCGGTFRSRRRKRGAKATQLSYQEQKARRILKKFGPNGQALGDDEDVKAQLEKGHRTRAKPRVAGSQRGRDLRAAAALARFDQQAKTGKNEERHAGQIKDEDVDDDETASGTDSETASDTEQEPAAVDINGQRLVDEKGRNLVKVCEDENPDDGDAQNEMRELLQSSKPQRKPMRTVPPDGPKSATLTSSSRAELSKSGGGREGGEKKQHKTEPVIVDLDSEPDLDDAPPPHYPDRTKAPATDATCAMCSFANETDATTCMVCSHVLEAARVPGAWRCQSEACKGSRYLNAGDSGVCGVCGKRKP